MKDKEEITLSEYEKIIKQTAIFPKEIGVMYCSLGLAGESGEVCEKVKKIYRDKNGIISEEDRKAIMKEISDVLWYCTALSHELNYSLAEVFQANYTKLMARRATGTLHGNGDDREEGK